MGVLVRALHATAERRSDTVQPFAIKDWLGRITGPGAPATPSSAMRLAVVYTCIKIIAEAVGSLPLISYRRRPDGGRERAPDFYLSELLQYEPNPEMEAVTFIETLTAHVAGWGNGYAEIVRDSGNRPTALWPLRPDRMTVLRNPGLTYRYIRPDSRPVDLAPSQVLHIRGLSFDGLMGHSPLAGDQTVEMAQTMKDYGTSFFRNNARPAIVAMHPKTLSPVAIERLVTQFEALKGGTNAGKTVVLEEGLSIKEIGIAPEDAQYLETSKMLRSEIIGKFLIPPHRAGDVERSTSWGTGIAEQNQVWLDVGLGMYLRRWEQAVRRSLITSAYRSEFYTEFLREALLRADPLARAQINHIAWMDGRLSADDINEMENRNHLPDGKGQGYYVPLNMIPVEMAGTDQQAAGIRSWQSSANPPALPNPIADLAVLAASNGHAKETTDE
jgi:HK97 family phage portal protein